MAAAIRKADIEPKLAAANAKLAAINPPRSADPQADALASWSGVKVDVVAYLMVFILGFAVEVVACLGVWLMQRPNVSVERFADTPPKGSTLDASVVTPNPSVIHDAALAKASPKGPTLDASIGPSVTNAIGTPKGSLKGSAKASGMNTAELKQAIEAFVLTQVALKRPIKSQRDLVERFGCAESTVSEVLAIMEAQSLIRRRMVGRCKITEGV